MSLGGEGGAAVLGVMAAVSLAHAQASSATPAPAVAAAVSCESTRLDGSLTEHVRSGHLSDAHALAEVMLAICPLSPLRFRWRILNALVLQDLDEPMRAEAVLFETMKEAPSPDRETAGVLLARGFSLSGDNGAFDSALGHLPRGTVARLRAFAGRDDRRQFQRAVDELSDPKITSNAQKYFAAYDQAAHARRPWLAGMLSAILPGAGQVYGGSWQGAAVAFALNAVLIGATAELALRHLYISAGATGVAASIFYVGNVLNAADLARRENEQAARVPAEALERVLIPEAYP